MQISINGTFMVGQSLQTRSICDSDTIYRATVLKRTPKTVTIQVRDREKRCKVHVWEGKEHIYPFGRYSMCPIFRA